MFKIRNRLINLFLLIAFCFLFWLFLNETFPYSKRKSFNADMPVSEQGERYDPSLLRLNTLNKLAAYCDSLYAANHSNSPYAVVVSGVISEKFYHGYSYYGKGHNVFAKMFEPFLFEGVSAIVIPDDIVKYPNAACSQQSIVGMELLKKKGIPVRKISMFDNQLKAGHFAFEAFYDGAWHFFDPNREPDKQVLNTYNMPSAEFLANHPDVVAAAYRRYDAGTFQRLLKSQVPGKPNVFPAKNALLYHQATKIISYTLWFIIAIILFIRIRKSLW